MTPKDKMNKLSNDQLSELLGDDSAQSDTGKIKILIVEDDNTTQLLYEKGLFNQVFDKKMAASGKEGLLIYNEWHPDIIILDIKMPELSGDQVLKEIRQTIGDQKTTIVMATSKSDRNDVQSCIDLGIEGYVVKPFSLREIGSKILSSYAKKEPERARKANVLHQETLNQSPMRLLLDKDKSKDTQGVSEETKKA
jgi:DNA-binding response OmpR family regulator